MMLIGPKRSQPQTDWGLQMAYRPGSGTNSTQIGR